MHEKLSRRIFLGAGASLALPTAVTASTPRNSITWDGPPDALSLVRPARRHTTILEFESAVTAGNHLDSLAESIRTPLRVGVVADTYKALSLIFVLSDHLRWNYSSGNVARANNRHGLSAVAALPESVGEVRGPKADLIVLVHPKKFPAEVYEAIILGTGF